MRSDEQYLQIRILTSDREQTQVHIKTSTSPYFEYLMQKLSRGRVIKNWLFIPPCSDPEQQFGPLEDSKVRVKWMQQMMELFDETPRGVRSSLMEIILKRQLQENDTLGIILSAISNGRRGYFVEELVQGKWAKNDGQLLEGDEILAINGRMLEAPSESLKIDYKALKKLMQTQTEITLTVRRWSSQSDFDKGGKHRLAVPSSPRIRELHWNEHMFLAPRTYRNNSQSRAVPKENDSHEQLHLIDLKFDATRHSEGSFQEGANRFGFSIVHQKSPHGEWEALVGGPLLQGKQTGQRFII
ncbi:hypothetical protein Ciccas_009677 [Cichlidogyrus casuarinus]|uniref:PDZ domain-containing protein n=1 Tax=Cichlidogyrus casuarinus TaxID=1844966 RepID=A0ABD2PX10_9PLAT